MIPLMGTFFPDIGLLLSRGRQLVGQSQLPLYELDQANIESKQGKIRPFGQSPAHLGIRAWRLFHAVKKADCARRVPHLFLVLGSMGLLLEHSFLFRWNADNLRLGNGMADFYADFSRTSLSGRIAQGMAYLFMEERGYAFGERFPTFLKRMKGQPGYDPAWRTRNAWRNANGKNPRKTPDFLFETRLGETALVESKGSFVVTGTRPNIKADLQDALRQLDGWDRQIIPHPQKKFAIGTYLREEDDESREPSLIAFVDPEDNEPAEPQYPRDWVRRGNYAAWLEGMGFFDAAHNLSHGRARSDQSNVRLP